MKKLILILAICFIGNSAYSAQTILKCTLHELHDPTVFTESFTAIEYPNVSLEYNKEENSYQVYIGVSGYSTKDNDLIKYSSKAGYDDEDNENYKAKFTIVPAEQVNTKYKYTLNALLEWDTNSATLSVTGFEGQTHKVADLVCTGRDLGY